MYQQNYLENNLELLSKGEVVHIQQYHFYLYILEKLLRTWIT